MMSIVKQALAEKGDIRMQLREKNDIVLNVLDFAGQGAYYASHQTYIRQNAIYIIVFDVSRHLHKRNVMVPADERNPDLCDRSGTSFSCWNQKGKYHITYS